MKRTLCVMMSLSVLVAAAGCKSKKQDGGGATGSGTSSAIAVDAGTGSGTGTGTGTGSGSGSAAAPHPSQAKTAVVEGATCPAGMHPVTDVPIKIDGATLSFERDRGGGCPQKPVYTVLYGKGEPMPVRVCDDPTADTCEMMIVAEKVTIDLTDALKAAGATTATLAK